VRVILIHNPGAGSRTDGDTGGLVALLRDEGHDVRPQSAEDPDWVKALQEPADVVAVAGGDGTVARVAKAMVGRGIPLAPLPAGTANNISRTLGLVGRHWEELVRAWPEARRVKLDVGVAEGPWGKRYFVEGVGAGLFACLLSSDDPQRKLAQFKRPDERVAHALEMLKKRSQDCGALDLRASVDGKDVSGRYLLFEAVSIPYVGPNLFLAPDSKQGDGQFDLIMVSEAERERLTKYLETWQTNRERLSVLPTQSGKHLHMEWNGFELHIDDELWPENGAPRPDSGVIDVRIGEEAVEFLAPASNNKNN
jgi:diacylglycerol kinase family enzyme